MSAPTNHAAFGETTLCDLAHASNGSVRLRNALTGAAGAGTLPFATVADYLASPAPIVVLRRVVRNFGNRTAHELDRMIRDRAPGSGQTDASGDLPDEGDVTAAVMALWRDMEFVDLRTLLGHVPTETRLGRVLRSQVGDVSCRLAVEEPDLIRDQVLAIGTAGVGTADELAGELRLRISRRVRVAGCGASMHDAVMGRLFGDTPGPSWRAEAPAERDMEERRDVVRTVLGETTCSSAFDNVVVSVRLVRLVRAVGQRPLAAALIDRHAFGWELARVPAVGRKTIQEFWDICWRTLAIALARAGVEPGARAGVAQALAVNAALLDARPEDLAELGLLLACVDGDAAAVMIPTDLDGLLDFLLARIRPQDVPVVRRRFGLDGGPGETLEEIGVDMRITRERVRQLEKRGLGDLSTLARRIDLRSALDADWARAWEALADGDDLVTDLEFATFRRSVPGAVTLALQILGLDLAGWLSTVSRRYAHGWLAPGRDPAPVDAILSALGALPDEPLLPRALHELGLPGDRLDMEAALLVGRGQRVLHGYLVEGRIGTRRRRALVAHAVLARTPGPVPLTDHLHAYHSAVPADRCSSRDLTIVMSDAPHLFLEVAEGRWAAIGAGGEIPAGGRPREEDAVEAAPAEQDLTVAAAIRDELARTGPQALASLTDDPRRYLPRDRSHNSVQPTLITRPDVFARLLPGVYALWSQIPSREDVVSGDVPYLLDRQQARIFAMARRAREPWGTFPLWSPEAEYRLCRWTAREGPSDVGRSLLAMATVDLWPLEDADRERWRARALADGRYDLLATLRPNVFGVRPELDRVLAALLDLSETGRTSWMTLNRIDGRHVASQVGCALLATLVLCGAVRQGDPAAESGWQLEHMVSHDHVGGLRSALEGELHRTGRLDWASDVGRHVAGHVLAGANRAPDWVQFNRFAELFRAGALAPTAPVVVDDDSVGEAGRALLAERRMRDLLDWLDER